MGNGMSFERLRDDYLLFKGRVEENLLNLHEKHKEVMEDLSMLKNSLEKKLDDTRKMIFTILMMILGQIVGGLLLYILK